MASVAPKKIPIDLTKLTAGAATGDREPSRRVGRIEKALRANLEGDRDIVHAVARNTEVSEGLRADIVLHRALLEESNGIMRRLAEVLEQQLIVSKQLVDAMDKYVKLVHLQRG